MTDQTAVRTAEESGKPHSRKYPGVPLAFVGWAAFVLDLGGPALAVLLGLVAAALAVLTGDVGPLALAVVGVLGGGVTAIAKAVRRRDKRESQAGTETSTHENL